MSENMKNDPPLAANVEQLVEKKVLQAKLTVTESRLNHVLVLAGFILTVFGILVPLWLANTSAERTDRAIERMEARFRELAGTALRKPDLDCFVGGKPLDGAVIRFSPRQREQFIAVRNVGDAPARNVRIYVYSNLANDFSSFSGDSRWQVGKVVSPDQAKFSSAYVVYSEGRENLGSIDPKDGYEFKLSLQGDVGTTNTAALIKVYYEQPEPKQVEFTISTSVTE